MTGSEEEEDVEGQEQARALLVEHARFQPGKFLSEEARVGCERLVAQHLAAGWSTQRLGRYLREWSAQAFNPSTWLPRQLRELGPPPAARRQPEQAAAAEAPPQSAPASDEARAAARALYPDTRPAGATSRQPRWKQRLQSNRTDGAPERAFADLDDLLGGHSSTA